MANALAHRTVAAALTGMAILYKEAQDGKHTLTPIGGSVLAAICTNLPDIVEPATNPHHRQFFHSAAFAAVIGGSINDLYQWKPQTEMEKLLKFCLLVAGGSYLIHFQSQGLNHRF